MGNSIIFFIIIIILVAIGDILNVEAASKIPNPAFLQARNPGIGPLNSSDFLN